VTPGRPPAIDLVVDTSAILALALEEPTAHAIQAVLESAGGPVISAAIVVELHIVAAARFGPAGAEAAGTILDAANVVTMPVDAIQIDLATTAWDRFGRGNSPARLNYGDCFSYALARHLDVPLLCVGDDFSRTDLDLVELTVQPGANRP
jgi:ribonuclease VapC